MKEIEGLAGEHIERACEKLAAAAPAFMVFNGVRVEAKPGDTADYLRGRWSEGMDRAREESERKRRAHEQTPEGQREIAAARAAEIEEKRAQAETLRTIETSGVRAKYPWPGAKEISGFGGGYEDACRTMVYAGLAWLDAHPGADLSTWKTPDAKTLDKVVMMAEPGCSGAMHGAAMSVCAFVAKQGWPAYVEAMTKRESA